MKLDYLLAKARAAYPGPWSVDEDRRPKMEWNRHIYRSANVAICFMAHSDGVDVERDKGTAEHIAACNPQTLISLIEGYQGAVEALTKIAWLRPPGACANHRIEEMETIALQAIAVFDALNAEEPKP